MPCDPKTKGNTSAQINLTFEQLPGDQDLSTLNLQKDVLIIVYLHSNVNICVHIISHFT